MASAEIRIRAEHMLEVTAYGPVAIVAVWADGHLAVLKSVLIDPDLDVLAALGE